MISPLRSEPAPVDTLTLAIFTPVHEAAASAPLRKVSTSGATAIAPRTKRRRRWSMSDVWLGLTASPSASDRPVEAAVSSIDSVLFIVLLPKSSDPGFRFAKPTCVPCNFR
jgi:hypothetical protein